MHGRAPLQYGLAQLRPDEDDWEPPQGLPQLADIGSRIALLQDEHRVKGRVRLTGHVIMACHALPYVCTLHPGPSSDSSDAPLAPTPSSGPVPLEIRPGHRLSRSLGLHDPPVQTAASLLGPRVPGRPRVHPGVSCSLGPPDDAAAGDKWVLEPRRGHAALNAGIRSLSTWRSVTLCACPADIQVAVSSSTPAVHLGSGKLSQTQRHALDAGLRELARGNSQSLGQAQLPHGSHGGGIECVPVWLDDRVAGLHYEGFCKKYLWPIFHYMPLSEHQDKASENQAWEAYEAVNRAFARRIADVYQPGDLVWVQDYHLLLVPRMLREMVPKCHIGLFLHSPFPSSEFFRCLPRREQILDGMLGSDLLCFQTYSYGRHFVSACIRVMGYESVGGGIECNGAITAITHCPIGIDAERIEVDRLLPGVRPKMDALEKLYEGKKIIVGRDKLDPTKGVVHKLRAFEALLKNYPQWRNRAVLIQVTSPSPTDSPQLATKISELVDHINATYGTLQFQPVHHYHQTVDQDEYFALLSVADLAVITSVRDGMNTTSMEYTICQKERKNPLILSEFTGVTGSMKSAFKVNPWDLGGVAKAIDQCLNMSESEKAQRHAQLYSRVKSHSSAVWASTLILQLLDCLRGDQTMASVKLLDEQDMIRKYLASQKRLLLFDYDGTLTPIVKNPKDAIPSQGLLDALERLCADEQNIVYIISGRDGLFLQKHLGSIANLGMSAEHGCFLRAPGAKEWLDLTTDIDMSWMDDVEEIFKYYEARTLGAFVEKKTSSVTWHYRNADPEFGLFQAKECQALLESMQERMPIDILKGKKNIECRPAHTNKGEIVKRLLYTTPEIGFALCAGDDKTDEDMFRALKMLRASTSLDTQPGQHHATTIEPPQTLALYPILARSPSSGPTTRPGESGRINNLHRRTSRSRYPSNTSMQSHSVKSSPSTSIGLSTHPSTGLPSIGASVPVIDDDDGVGGGSSTLAGSVSSVAVPGGPLGGGNVEDSPKFEPVESGLDTESIFSIVIDANESRKTLAEYRLNQPKDLVAVLQRLSKV